MFKTTGHIDEDLLREILANRRSTLRTVMIWVIFVLGLLYILVALFLRDWFGASMAAIMAFLGYYALFRRPAKWLAFQRSVLSAAGGSLEYTVSYENDCIRILCHNNGWKGTLAYSNFKSGLRTDRLIVLFTFKDEYVVTFLRQLTPRDQELLREHLSKKLPGRFRWSVHTKDEDRKTEN